MVKVKVCGITRMQDALLAVELGADILGFNFWPGTLRRIDLENARKIFSEVKGKTEIAGVFVNQPLQDIIEVAQAIQMDWAQLHGEETPEYCNEVAIPVIKALRLDSEADLRILNRYSGVRWLIDSKTPQYGGSGVSPDWGLAKKAGVRAGKIILAGGLNPENVAEAIKAVQPWAVDVASGVEGSPGIKDHLKLEKFIEAVRNATG